MKDMQKKWHNRQQKSTLAIIIIVGIVVSYFLGPHKIKGQNQKERGQKTPPSVSTIILGDKDTKSAILEKSAKFTSIKTADVISEYSGKIEKVYFNVGDKVREGQILAIFEQSVNQNSPRVSLNQAIAIEKIAQENLSKTKELTEKGIAIAKNGVDIAEVQLKQAEAEGDKNKIKISKEQLSNAKKQKKQAEESAELQINAARLQIIQAQAARQQAEITYSKTIIKSPISGTVTSKTITENEFINFGNKLAQIVGDGFLETIVYLNDSQVKRISIGDEVILEFSGKSYQGKISNFSEIANSGNSRYEVRIVSDEKIPEAVNLYAKILIPLQVESQNKNIFFVPLEAVNIGQQKSTVFVVEDEKAFLREVKVGETIGTEVEIVEGLEINEEVIVKNNRNLEDGQPVKVER